MPEAVSSGLGRNGPWLQNQWIRVETRVDDASIALVSISGAFRPIERAIAFAELDDEAPLIVERADYDVQRYEDELGKGRRLTLRCALPRRGATLVREVVMYDAHRYVVTRVGLTNTRPAGRVANLLHAFTTPSAGRGRLQFAGEPASWRVYRHGWQSWSPTMSLGATGPDLRNQPLDLAPEAPESQPGRFASDDVGVLFDPISGRSILAGAATARDFVTQTFVDAPARTFDARCLTDGMSVESGETLWSERILVDITGHPNEQLERYGDALARLMSARVPVKTPAGWCSWYYFYTGVTEDDVVRNLRFLEEHRRELPIDTVQIDDGYQADIGDWLTTNEKFPRGMSWLAQEIKRAGYMPGLWLAPFLLAESSKTYAEHPDWVVRDDDGAPVIASANWQRKNFGLDGSHPAARAWLTELFRAVCDGWGYDYVKTDFLFGGAIAGTRHDPRTTRIRAYRDALAAVRAGVGDQRFILGCGALMAPSVGIFDGNRIGPDVAPFWRNLTSAERADPGPRARRPDDQLSTETAIRNTLQRWWMGGRLWANDPDCLLARTDRTKLSLDETRTLASIIGLSAGMMLSSDDLPNVPPERLHLISMLLPVLPEGATPVDLIESDMPEQYELAVERDWDPVYLVGLFNFDDVARDLRLPLRPGRWHAFELWEERYRGVVEGAVDFALVAPHACRVVALRPERGVPQLVGTTGHIGVGVLDVTYQAFDGAGGRLRLELGPAGSAKRRIYVAGGGRVAIGAQLGGVEIGVAQENGICRIDAEIDEPTTLDLLFEADGAHEKG